MSFYGQSSKFHFIKVNKTKPNNKERTSLPNFIKTKYANFYSCIVHRRMSLHTSIQASLTVEAAILVPLFLFFFIDIIWIIQIIGYHSQVGQKMHETGNQMVTYSYSYEVLTGQIQYDNTNELIGVLQSVGWSELYLRQQIMTLPCATKMEHLTTCISNIGLSGEIKLQAVYEISLPFPFPGMKGIWLTNSYYSKCYRGYRGSYLENDQETLVYVTQTGDVYHNNRNCTHLKFEPKKVLINDISQYRNKDGCKYYACEICGDNNSSNSVYISEYGTRYHQNEDCSSFHLTVYEIPLSMVGERRLCISCQ